MKTPREILLGRHASAEPELDKIRARTVAGASGRPNERASWMFSWTRLFRAWLESFQLRRVAWAGFGAAWIVIVALNIASSETAAERTPMAAARVPVHSPEMRQALREQKRFFDEMIGAVNAAVDADGPRFVPRPRSEGTAQTSVA